MVNYRKICNRFLLITCLFFLMYSWMNFDLNAVSAEEKQAVRLDYSNPANNAIDVDPDSEILLTFDKNVVHMTIAEKNKQLISLIDSLNTIIPITIEMADDQIYREKRREVIIKPTNSLTEGETYTVVVKEGFHAKNGTTTTEQIHVSFTVKKGTTVPNDKAPASSNQEKGEPENTNKSTDSPENSSKSSSTTNATKVTANEPTTDTKANQTSEQPDEVEKIGEEIEEEAEEITTSSSEEEAEDTDLAITSNELSTDDREKISSQTLAESETEENSDKPLYLLVPIFIAVFVLSTIFHRKRRKRREK